MKRRDGFAETSFGAVHYWMQGAGPTVLLIHQSAQASCEYSDVAPYLAEHYHVVAVDLPGHGDSDDPDHELTLEEYTQALVEILDALELSVVHAVGHHGGAYLALSLATEAPDRVNRVVMSGAGVLPQEIIDSLLHKPMSRDLPMDENGQFLRDTWGVYRKMSAAGVPLEITMRPFLVGLQARMRPYDMHYAALRWDKAAAARKLDKPALLIRAAEDMYAGDIDALQAMIPGSTITDIEGGGAWLFYEQPAACAAAIREFLSA